MDLTAELSALRQRAENLLQRAETLRTSGQDLAGIGKVKKKIQAELTFIKSIQEGKILPKKNQLKSTNLSHLDALLYTAESFGHVTALLKPVSLETDEGYCTNVIVDIVGHKGRSWVKVTARKAEALHRIWEGEGEYGEHDIVQQVAQYQEASHQNPLHFSAPSVHVVFFSGITQAVADELIGMGVVVHGHIFKDESQLRLIEPEIPVFQAQEDIEDSIQIANPKAVNLDVTTMIALVTDLCHGGSSYCFNEPLIEELAQQERTRPLLPQLENYLQDKKLIACETAVTDFEAILKTIGGPREKQRAQDLLTKLTVVPDQPSIRSTNLSISNKIKERSKVIFGSGDALKLITTTANEAFVRATSKQGVNYSVFIHQSRALTEKKQQNPSKASPSQSSNSNNNSLPSSIEQGEGLDNDNTIGGKSDQLDASILQTIKPASSSIE
ncbi:UPF0415 protein C7orf25 homolog [Diadema antillarum]|uniref:UPF0415 protein C7orf25 homolog n=1 Tax=Diadema antillarum TaxID=105358 RepID=UPI003A8BEF0F